MRNRPSVPLAAAVLALAIAGCSGGDSSPDDAADGGMPPQSSVSPQPNIGQSEGYPDSDAQQEANTHETEGDDAPGTGS